MQFEFTLSVEVERSQGKFASRDELEEKLVEEIDGANPGNLEGDEGGEYEITTWEVNAAPKETKSGKPKREAPRAPARAGWLGLAVPEVEAVVVAWQTLKEQPEDVGSMTSFEFTMEALQKAVLDRAK